MSIKPKVVNIKKQNYTTFHMRINNGSNEDIEGYISYKVTMPNGEEKIVEYNRTERIMANSEINLLNFSHLGILFSLGYPSGIV